MASPHSFGVKHSALIPVCDVSKGHLEETWSSHFYIETSFIITLIPLMAQISSSTNVNLYLYSMRKKLSNNV